MKKIQMVDLQGQYQKIKNEIDKGIDEVIENAQFINGPQVKTFAENLAKFLQAKHVIPCANGTDALQIAIMALDLPKGSNIICPAFNYVATAETVALLGYDIKFVDVDAKTFNIDIAQLEKSIDKKTSAVMPVHLFGQCANMADVMKIAKKHNILVIEDVAQAIGSEYYGMGMAGTIGDVGTTSFFPSKNLGCYGDGGAIYTNSDTLAEKLKMIANHGQKQKYQFDCIGVNSRLDTLQAVILDAKLKHLKNYISERQKVADFYDQSLSKISQIKTPFRDGKSSHVFHQYTLQVPPNERENLGKYLSEKGIPTMIYYPKPLHLHKAYEYLGYKKGDFPISESMSESVLSLPIHTEMDNEQLEYITSHIKNFFK